MDNVIKAGEVFKLANLVSYIEGKVTKVNVVDDDRVKFILMAFDAGSELPKHAAPGDAIVFALEGEAVISYEGQDHSIKAGENFHFAKADLHSVKATKQFKMALLLTLD